MRLLSMCARMGVLLLQVVVVCTQPALKCDLLLHALAATGLPVGILLGRWLQSRLIVLVSRHCIQTLLLLL